MYLLLRSGQPWNVSVGLKDPPTAGLSKSSQDPWGYYFVEDFDDAKNSPFLLTRSRP